MISRLDKNTFNFIRWRRVTGADTNDLPITTLDSISLSSEYELTNDYLRNNYCYFPALLRNNDHLIHINLDERIDDADFADWRVDLYDNTGTQIDTGLGTLTKCSIEGSDYRMYFTCNIDPTVPNGIYQMVILDVNTDAVIYQSNCIEVITSNEIGEYSYLQFRNSTDLFYIDYANITSYNSLFLKLNMIEQNPEIELIQYKEQTTGILRNQKAQSSKTVTLETYFFDEGGHDAMLALSLHDDIKINGRQMEVKNAYQRDSDPKSSLNKGTIEMYDQKYSTVNLNG